MSALLYSVFVAYAEAILRVLSMREAQRGGLGAGYPLGAPEISPFPALIGLLYRARAIG